jgi:cytochrome c biogenesis protein CcmG, thiol:disulfide interchange protein DsbE
VTGSASSAERPAVGWWFERRLRRATQADALVLVGLLLLGATAVLAGRRARLTFRPRAAVEIADSLDALDVPTRLPNASLVDDASGVQVPLRERVHKPRGVVAFYAPWCGPCQKELPLLAEELGPYADILVVVSADEDRAYARRELANLGLSKLGFFVDQSGLLQSEARVKALPTTFLITNAGAVLSRTVGYSAMGLFQMKRKAAPDDESLPGHGREK